MASKWASNCFKLEACWAAQCARGMVKGVWRKKASDEKDAEFLLDYSSEDILRI